MKPAEIAAQALPTTVFARFPFFGPGMYTRPTPQQVRDWMKQRQVEHKPPPSPERIREQLGWRMIEVEQQGAERAR